MRTILGEIKVSGTFYFSNKRFLTPLIPRSENLDLDFQQLLEEPLRAVFLSLTICCDSAVCTKSPVACWCS